MSNFPAILQYGLTGLAAIIVFLAYRLLAAQTTKTKPNNSILKTIKFFMVLSIVLVVLSGTSSAVELLIKNQNGDAKTVDAKLEAAQQEIERLKGELANRELAAQQEQRTLDRLVANRLEAAITQYDLEEKQEAAGPARANSVPAILLKRAVFREMFTFGADKATLERALNRLADRGLTGLQEATGPVLGDFANLMKLRLRWLKDRAIPILQEDIDYLRTHPTQCRPAGVFVPVPNELLIFDPKPDEEPMEMVDDMETVLAEIKLLEEKL